jgi:polysaccharide export outer membrane protein
MIRKQSRLRFFMGYLCLVFATVLSVSAQPPTLDHKATPSQLTDSSSMTQKDQSSLAQTYILGPEDVLEIRVFNRPQLSRDAVRIDERGMIQMPLIAAELQASCRTVAQLAREITLAYAKYLRKPQVDVFVKEYQSQPVAVVGAVNAPGRFQLRRPARLLELLTFAGGPSEKGGRQVQVAHAVSATKCEIAAEGSGESETTFEAFELGDTLRGDERANPFVRPGDVITVPEAQQAFIVGNITRPMSITLKEPTTITQAIAMAGGTMPDTKSDRVRIVRQTPAGRKEIIVDLNAIAKHRAEDPLLQANDIIDVPTSAGKRFLRTLTSAIAPAVSRLPVRVIP